MSNSSKNQEMVLRVFQHAFKETKDTPKSKPRIMVLYGLEIKVDRVWFTGSFDTEQYRLVGKDWVATISLKGSSSPWRHSLEGRDATTITVGREKFYLKSIEVSDVDLMDRDLALLRMFGIEELFSDK